MWVTRLKLWVKLRTKKDGTAVNTNAAEKIKKAADLVQSEPNSSANPKEDHLAKVLGPENPGRLRAMGRGMSMSKYACFQMKNKHMTEMQQIQVHLQQQVLDLQEAILKMKNQRPEPEVGENSAPRFSLARRTKLRKFGRARRSSRRPKVTILIWKDRYLSHASRRSGMKPFGSTMRPRLIFYRDMSGKRVNEAHGGFGVSNGPSSSAKGLDRIEKRPG
ncbi:unnamed protein product [Microthlaspi erraticum]|uniref:Uncharacterized protein n=1 Tax=Microthlaspi erraticum TaxID=1685480 RepID=A0A6D2HPH2_9BRAS|nr:unnamed protein product [Microthlaspi erraticum]CAA7040529.1 unnamed protein product [Microthlaspi erraticum]